VNGHTSFKLKRRIFVVLRNGRSFVDRLLEQHSKYYRFETEGRVQRAEIRTAAYARPEVHQ
jgi:hypothetical protein